MIDIFSKFDASYVKMVLPFQHACEATRSTVDAHSHNSSETFQRCARKIALPRIDLLERTRKVFQSIFHWFH